jgi:hypothetical protein
MGCALKTGRNISVTTVERFQPLFHLLNGDLSYADLNSFSQPEVWSDFANNVQISAANRPWMPCPAAREEWLPLFDKYGVDLVLCGHDHDYERSYPVRGANHNAGRDATTGAVVDTLQPRPVIPANPAATKFDTTQGIETIVFEKERGK